MRGVRASDYSQNTLGVNFNNEREKLGINFSLINIITYGRDI